MSVARASEPGRRKLFDYAIVRYAFALSTVVAAFALRKLLEPVTGTGAPFVLFFGAVLLSSIFGGTRAGFLAAVSSTPLGAYEFIVRAHHHAPSQAVFQAALFAVDCGIVLYLSFVVARNRRAAEGAEERLRLANDAAAIRSWDLDVASNQLRWSPDVPPESAPTSLDEWRSQIHPLDRDEFDRAHERALDPAGDGTIRRELRIVRSDGVRWLSWTGRTYFAETTGRRVPARQVGTAIDVTERRQPAEALKQVSAELARAVQRFRELIELAPDAFFLADLDGRFTDVNRTACRMLGYERHELVGKTIQDLIPAEDVPRLIAMKSDLSVQGQVVKSEWMVGRKDGTFLPVEVSSNILPDGRWQLFARDITGRKRIEDEHQHLLAREQAARQESEAVNARLRESEERFRFAIDEAPIGMALVALDGRFVRVNRVLCEIVGYSREELEQLTFQDITHPDDVTLDVTSAGELARGEIARYHREKRYIRKDGTIVTVMVSASILRAGDGTPLYYITQMQDITESKRAEEALRLSEARFSGIIAISTDAIISIDKDQRITLFNNGAERIFGYSRSEAIGAPLENLLPERLRAIHREHVASFMAGQPTARGMGEGAPVIVGMRKSGEEFPAEAAISKLQVDGTTTLTVALRDVTDRKRLENEQRILAEAGAVLTSSLDLEQTLTSVGRLVARELADWCIVEVAGGAAAPRHVRIIGADPCQAPLAEELERLLLDQNRPAFVQALSETKHPFMIERMTPGALEAFAPSSEHLPLLRAIDPRSVMGLPLVIRGELLGVLVIISTTPSHVYTTNDLRFAAALADRVALVIEKGRLYQLAVQATRLRDQVLGVVAHDLRNPLSVITMQATALEPQPGQPDRRSKKPKERILRAATRMSHLIQDLLDVTLVEAGQLGIEREPISVPLLLQEVVEAERSLASSASLDLRLDMHGDLPDMLGDQHRLHQVLENLIGNAIKFTPTGGRITIGAAARAREVVLWVSDTGRGISTDGLLHVFDRFWQATKSTHHGAGLGLPIARGIVEAHGGHIWVESTPGRGSTFFFTIPRVSPAQAQLAESSRSVGMG